MAPLRLVSVLPYVRRSQVFNETRAIMEPLSGVVDGSRRTFRTTDSPLIYDPSGLFGPPATVLLYDYHENAVASALYTLTSPEAGAIQFTAAPRLDGSPTPPFYASYTWADLDLATLYGALIQGFDEMELRFSRGFTLSPVASTVSPLAGQLDLAVTDTSGNDPTGPGGTTFGTSTIQRAFLVSCTFYRLARDYFFAASKRAYGYREGRMGMEVDPRAALKAQQEHLAEVSRAMEDLTYQATADWDQADGGLGSAVYNPASSGYAAIFDWKSPASGYGGVVG